MTMNLAAALTQLLERERALDAELAAVRTELFEIRSLLAVPSDGPKRPSQAARVKEWRQTPITKICPTCRQEFTGQKTQNFCDRCLEATRRQSHKPETPIPEPSPAPAPDSTCERCGKAFTKKATTAGRFCSRECYQDRFQAAINRVKSRAAGFGHDLIGVTYTGDRWATSCRGCRATFEVVKTTGGVDVTEPFAEICEATQREVLRSKNVAPLAERRCGRCMHKFKPTREKQYVCDGCTKPVIKPAPPEPELVTDWTPAKDARPLTSGEGLGSSLGGGSFKSHA